MPTLTLHLRLRQRPDLVLDPETLRARYLVGVRASDLPADDDLEDYIWSAQALVEQTLSLRLLPQQVEETITLTRDDFATGLFQTSLPVVKALRLEGGLASDTKTVAYPAEWLSVRQASPGLPINRSVHLVPNGQASVSGQWAQVITGQQLMWLTNNMPYIPNYWRLTYQTGFSPVPPELRQFVGRLAALGALYQAAGIVLGAGIGSRSISLDGLSQSVSASNPFATAIKGYQDEGQQLLATLKPRYLGIAFIAL